ncbi:hypothetical protein [Segeticoccus rhizosphaerae]|jgi:hypothetical protein|uniref:hypothetical protein n=1 Tax=Segeticoccus rhizosphaerae TaxID=1104777 RepID=UPI0010BFD4D6|nr:MULTISPECIES: hypothetical protein [Intrasporangiaceae]
MSNDGWDGDIDARFDDIIAHWDEPGPDPEATGEKHHDKAVNPPPQIRFGPGAGRPGTEADGSGPGGQTGDVAGSGAETPRTPGQPDGRDTPGSEGTKGRESSPGSSDAAAAGPPGQGWRSHAAPEEEEHFVPPPPAPLPAGDLQFWGILVGLVGGPGLLLYLIMFDRDAGSLWIALAIALSLGGFGLLVARLPNRRDDDDDDDGARV